MAGKWTRSVARRGTSRLPSPAMVVACLSLVLALGGTGYAAGLLPVGSVGTPQLKADAVVSSKVKDGSLLAKDFRAGQLPAGARGAAGVAGERGAAGPQGVAGLQGQPGSQGPAGFSSLTYVAADYGPFPAGAQYGGEAVCTGGRHAVGGGVFSESADVGEQQVNSSYPSSGAGDGEEGTTAWWAYVDNTSSAPRHFRVYAVCAAATSVSGP